MAGVHMENLHQILERRALDALLVQFAAQATGCRLDITKHAVNRVKAIGWAHKSEPAAALPLVDPCNP